MNGRGHTFRLGRFERRVLAVIAFVAFVPLVFALVLGRAVLAESYRVGVNPRVGEQLASSLDAHRDHLVALRADAERTADAVAFDYRLEDALSAHDTDRIRAHLRSALERYPHLVAVAIADTNHRAMAEVRRVLDSESFRQISLERHIESENGAPLFHVRIELAAPIEPFRAYERAGEVAEVYRHLEASTSYVSDSYLAVYIALLLAIVVIALTIGIVVSRRVTRRIVVLADATKKVGAGDLSIEVPTDQTDEVGELTHAFNAMVRDIRASRDRIEYLKRVGAWQEMAKRLAHQIKNPLTPIQLAVQQVHQSYRGDDPNFRRTLDDVRDIVEEEIAALRRWVKEFSDFARLPVPELTRADLRDFAREAIRGIDPRALASEKETPRVTGSTPITMPIIALEMEDEELPVMIDPQMLRACLDNLVRNAIQALVESRNDETIGQVIIATRRSDDGHVLLEVRDNGPGIPPETRERVFDPYYTTRGDGTGLGLAIVKKTILEHGGTITCDESKEGGAMFRIQLPLDRNRT
jgi:nitrogen fixation/metabolism regulation signal transduction histidine kinase